MNKKYLTTKEISKKYGVKDGTLRRQRWGRYGLPFVIIGRKPGQRTGGLVRYDADKVDEYIRKNERVAI